VNLDLPLFDPTPSELDALLEDLDRSLDAAFMSDLEAALARASSAGVYDAPAAAAGETSAA
jgi:hypothetical protein